jgi:hypothetical protein
MKDSVLAELAALKGAPAPALKARWRELFDAEPPPYNRSFLESRLAYRIQELAYGRLKRDAIERLRALAKQDETAAKRNRWRPAAGEHERIVDRKLWDKVHAILQVSA